MLLCYYVIMLLCYYVIMLLLLLCYYVLLCSTVCIIIGGSRPSRGRQHLSACAGYGNYIIHILEHFHLNILPSVQYHN